MTKKEIRELIMKFKPEAEEQAEREENIYHLNKDVHDVMFRRFVSEVEEASGIICRVPAMEARKIAVDFIQNNDYAKMCLTATINLALDGTISKKQQLDDFLNKLLWSHVVEACHEKLNGGK